MSNSGYVDLFSSYLVQVCLCLVGLIMICILVVLNSSRNLPLHIRPAGSTGFRVTSWASALFVIFLAFYVGYVATPRWRHVCDSLAVLFVIFGLILPEQITMRLRPKPKDPPLVPEHACPFVTIIVPALNEGCVLQRLMESISKLYYPKSKLQVIIVNDGSTDDTEQITAELEKRYSYLSTINLTKGTGSKSGAMNVAYSQIDLRAAIVGYLDGDAIIDSKALMQIIARFRDLRVGAIQAPKSINTKFCYGIREKFQFYEMLLDGASQQAKFLSYGQPDLHGDGQFVRKDVLERMGAAQAWNTNTPTDDLDFTIRLSLLGYRVVYLPNMVAILEEPVYTWQQFYTQRERWTTGFVQRSMDYLHWFAVSPWGYVSAPGLPAEESTVGQGEPFGEFNWQKAKASERAWHAWADQVKLPVHTKAQCSDLHLGVLKLRLLIYAWMAVVCAVGWLNALHMLFNASVYRTFRYSEIIVVLYQIFVMNTKGRENISANWKHKRAYNLFAIVSTIPISLALFLSFFRLAWMGRSLEYKKSGRQGDSTTKASSGGMRQGHFFLAATGFGFTCWVLQNVPSENTTVLMFVFSVPLLSFVLSYFFGALEQNPEHPRKGSFPESHLNSYPRKGSSPASFYAPSISKLSPSVPSSSSSSPLSQQRRYTIS
eukprot:gb/GEZN01002769.1/.p1 GENE.gb/GEZN01002769.1/~~gb/GEZN01002769.1/.p1  ORF type:complete len:657 (+),score=79.65 gb/GEZN01002769.1/:30-2000(+)